MPFVAYVDFYFGGCSPKAKVGESLEAFWGAMGIWKLEGEGLVEPRGALGSQGGLGSPGKPCGALGSPRRPRGAPVELRGALVLWREARGVLGPPVRVALWAPPKDTLTAQTSVMVTVRGHPGEHAQGWRL